MASSTDPKSDQEYGKAAPPPPQPRPDAPAVVNYFAVDVALRVLLFAAAVTGIVVIVTSDQTKWVPGINGFGYRKAKFNHSPAFIYYVVAMSIAGLYALITILASISVLFKPNFQTKLLLHLAFLDVLILGIVASATGSAGGVAYVGLKGNKHVGWTKVCSAYDKFCQHLAGSLAVSLFACVLLVFLSWLSIFSLHARIHKY